MTKKNRHNFLRVALLFLTAALIWTSCTGESGSKQPNLLVIYTDQLNFRTMGCYRETISAEQAHMWGKESVVETPNLDWMAENGALCTKFYATTPVCSPSRSSFVSGMYPQNTDVAINDIPMNDSIVTFAEVLGRNGYKTGYAGKWHLDGKGRPQWAPKRQFGFQDNQYMFNNGHWKKFADTPEGPKVDTGEEPSTDVSGATEKNFATDWLTDKTIDFIKANHDNPFCYMLSIPDPHPPYSVRSPYDTMYTNMSFTTPHTANRDPSSTPSWAKPEKVPQSNIAQYFGMVKCIDDNVGRIFDFLRESKLLDNTIVVFTSDHGAMLGEHNRYWKGVPLEASAKVPFLIYYPDKIKPGTLVEQALGAVDFMPTVY